MAKLDDLIQKKPKTYITIILDKSGSMGTCRDFAVSTYNEQLDVIRETAKEQEVLVTLIEFSNDVEFKVTNESIDKISNMELEDFKVLSSTALNDAIGFAINNLVQQKDIGEEHVSALLLIITDGYENASREYNTLRINEQMDDLKKTNRWTFTFMGASTDPEAMRRTVMNNYGLEAGNTVAYSSFRGELGLCATADSARSTRSFLGSRLRGVKSVSNFYDSSQDTVDVATESDTTSDTKKLVDKA